MDVDTLAGSPWSVVLFVVAAIAVTRLLDAGLKDKLPKWLLPYISMVVGLAGQMALGLSVGMDWKKALLYGFAAGAGGSWVYSAGAKRLPAVKADKREDGTIRAALLCLLSAGALLCYLVALQGCATTLPDVLAKTQSGLTTVSKTAEPMLQSECVDRAKACVAKGIRQEQCTPVLRCKQWVAVYVAATKTIHAEAATLNRLWQELQDEGVIE